MSFEVAFQAGYKTFLCKPLPAAEGDMKPPTRYIRGIMVSHYGQRVRLVNGVAAGLGGGSSKLQSQ